jgi:hypothetical protein
MAANGQTQSSKKPSYEELAQAYAAQQAEIERLKAAQQASLKLKVSEKGAVSCYGLGRFPVTLYSGQWERLLAAKAEIEAFIQANAGSLSTKG